MNKAIHRTPPLRLGLDDPNGQVLLQNERQSFLLTVQELVTACGMMNRMADIQTQTKDLLEDLSRWVADRKDKVREAYLSVKGSGLLFLVITRAKQFDPSFEDELTALDVKVANASHFSLLNMDTLALPDVPKDCVDSFLG